MQQADGGVQFLFPHPTSLTLCALAARAGSPVHKLMKALDPRCTPLSGRHGPSGYVCPLLKPSSAGSE
jgi:hypothetical protein